MATSPFLVPVAFHQLEDVPIRLANFEGSRALKAEMLGVKRLLRDEIRDHQAARMSATSANFSVKVVRNAFKAAIRERLLSENPAGVDFIDPIKRRAENHRHRAFTFPELQKL